MADDSGRRETPPNDPAIKKCWQQRNAVTRLVRGIRQTIELLDVLPTATC